MSSIHPMGHLFISYSRKDQGQVHRLIQRLETAGHHVWIDNQGIQVGDLFPERIVNAIQDCQAFILVLSEHSIESDWVRQEVGIAREEKKRILPINLDGVQLPDSLRLQLRDIQQLDLSKDFERGVMTLLQVLSGAPAIQPKQASDICPYKGLEFFDCNDEDPKYFFGREALVSRLIEHVRCSNFLALVGASGNGKSSVLRAGLLHQLKLGQLIEGSDRWRIRITRPDREPMTNLAMAFVEDGLREVDRATELEKVASLLEKGEVGLKRLIQVAPEPRVILVIDQFEEVFTRCKNDEERDQYLATLMGALEGTDEKLCLIIAMRADFFVKCMEREYSGLAQRIDTNLVSVTPMKADELKSAILKPAEQIGLNIEGELVTEIINDIQGAPGSLPLLQYSLKELWQARQNNQLTLIAYQSLGGIQGTLDQRATDIYNDFDSAEQLTVQHIFQQLTQLGEGTEDTRRRVFQDDLIAEPHHSAQRIQKVIHQLSSPENRLLVTSEVENKSTKSKRMAIVDVAHEALIRHWQLLRKWIEQNRDLLRKQRKIEASAVTWRQQGKTSGDLLIGKPLIEAIDFNQQQAQTFPLSDSAKVFINRSLRQRRWNRLKLAAWLIIPALIVVGLVEHNLRERGVKEDYARLNVQGTYDEKLAAEALVLGCGIHKELSWFPFYLSERLFGNCRSLAQAPLAEANLSDADLSDADLSDADLSSADLISADLSSADLSYAKLSYAKLSYAKLSYAKLSYAKLSSAKLRSANLSYAKLSSADLSNAYIRYADLRYADLRYADLSDADLSNAKLSNAKLSNANLSDADLSDADLSDADLSYADLSSAKLSDANLRSADLSYAKLSYAKLSYASLLSADLSSANLRSANLRSADLSNADLSNADLSNADLSNAILLATDLRSTRGLNQGQFNTQYAPLLCNSPIPNHIEISPDRDCDKLPEILTNRYPSIFDTLEKATEHVNELRKKT